MELLNGMTKEQTRWDNSLGMEEIYINLVVIVSTDPCNNALSQLPVLQYESHQPHVISLLFRGTGQTRPRLPPTQCKHCNALVASGFSVLFDLSNIIRLI